MVSRFFVCLPFFVCAFIVDVFAFQAVVCAEGSTGNLRVTVPARFGAIGPAWYAAAVDGVELLVFVRRPPSRPSSTFTLPSWAFSTYVPGAKVAVTLTPPVRASGTVDGFDWLPFAPERCFPTQDGDDLLLWSQHEPPFRLRRSPTDLEAHYRLLGYYQAEGSKAKTGMGWSFASKLRAPARSAVSMLGSWGLPPSRCFSEVLYGHGEAPEDAEAYYQPVGLRVAATRLRTGRGDHAIVIHVHSSVFLREMTIAVLAHIAQHGFPSAQAARAYALGWLDGDGCIISETAIRLDLAGSAEEHRVAQEAFKCAFGWEPRGQGWINDKSGTRIHLRLSEMATLLEAGVFPYTMSRARLLFAFDERTAPLRSAARQSEPFRLERATWCVRHGLVRPAQPRGYCMTEAGRALVETHKRLQCEIEALRHSISHSGITRQKGEAYPLCLV